MAPGSRGRGHPGLAKRRLLSAVLPFGETLYPVHPQVQWRRGLGKIRGDIQLVSGHLARGSAEKQNHSLAWRAQGIIIRTLLRLLLFGSIVSRGAAAAEYTTASSLSTSSLYALHRGIVRLQDV